MFLQYQGAEMQQNANMPSIFQEFLQYQNFPLIIEIGTRYGGFTRLLKDCSPQSVVYSYDILNQKSPTINPDGINFIIKNIFNIDLSEVIDLHALSLLTDKKRKLVLCDGGNKIKEFNCISKYINVGDFIMAHDYASTLEYFNSNIYGKVWNWCEITEADIAEASSKNNLVHYNQLVFNQAAWVCKIKVQ